MKVVILAGGKGMRLAPYTMILPKPLVPVGQYPIIEILVRQLARSGFRDIVLSIGYLGELIQAYFAGNHARFKDVSVSYFRESEPLGTAGPLGLIPGLNETFLTLNGDILTSLDFGRLLEYHRQREAALTIAVRRREVQVDLGVVQLNANGELTGYLEKPVLDYLVSMGVYVYEPVVLKYIEPGRYLDFPTLTTRLLECGERVVGYLSEDYWLDIGRHEDYVRATAEFESKREAFRID